MQEHQNVEWKESWDDEYLKWICGYANAQGGILYIGIFGSCFCRTLLKKFCSMPSSIRITIEINNRGV